LLLVLFWQQNNRQADFLGFIQVHATAAAIAQNIPALLCPLINDLIESPCLLQARTLFRPKLQLVGFRTLN